MPLGVMSDEISHINLSKLSTMEQWRSIIMVLMNTVETMSAKIAAQEKENRELQNAINVLKGK